jgi:hypothetical protein
VAVLAPLVKGLLVEMLLVTIGLAVAVVLTVSAEKELLTVHLLADLDVQTQFLELTTSGAVEVVELATQVLEVTVVLAVAVAVLLAVPQVELD